MATIHTKRAKKQFRRERDAVGNGTWVEVPVVDIARRTEKLPDPGPKIAPNLDALPDDILETILKPVVKHHTPLTSVPKKDAIYFRRAAAFVARDTVITQELNRYRNKRLTRADSKRSRSLRAEQLRINLHNPRQALAMAYNFVNPPVFHVNRGMRVMAFEAFRKVNQFTIRPDIELDRGFHFWYEGHMQKMQFDSPSMEILSVAPRLHVILHWHFVPIFKDYMVRRRGDIDDRPRWLKISLVGKLDSEMEMALYFELLQFVPADVVEITWSPGVLALMKTPPNPRPRENRWPQIQYIIDETVKAMETGGVPTHKRGTIFEPFPI